MRISDWSSDVCSSDLGVELKAFQGTTPGDGGYAVPREIDSVIEATLNSISPIRAIANVVSVGSAGYRKLVTTGGVASGWAAEDGDRAETATPPVAEIAPPMGDLFVNPAASQAIDRTSVGKGQRGAVRVVLGGDRNCKKK